MGVPSPKDHPNAYAATAAGYVASLLVFIGLQVGIDITPQDAAYFAPGIIAVVLFIGSKSKKYLPTEGKHEA